MVNLFLTENTFHALPQFSSSESNFPRSLYHFLYAYNHWHCINPFKIDGLKATEITLAISLIRGKRYERTASEGGDSGIASFVRR